MSIEKRHVVRAVVNFAGVWWLLLWHMMAQYSCDSGSTNKLFLGASYFHRKPMELF